MLFSTLRSRLLLLFAVCTLLLAGMAAASDPLFQIRKHFSIFSDVIAEVNELYVVEVSPEEVIQSGIEAMLETLDPYTVLIDETKSQDIDIMTTGSYAGVGIEVGARGGELVVITPIEGYPAARQGIRAGDVIVSINGISTEGLSPTDINTELRGQVDSVVELSIRRFGMDEPMEFSLVRERIEVKNVKWAGFADEQESIAYVLLSRFGQNAGGEVREALEELQDEAGGELEGVVLDLRNNPGGLLMEAVRTAEIFLPSGLEVVSTRGRAEETNQRYGTEQPPLLPDLPLVVLQNTGSASSSEIVSGAIQDYDRGIIMGQRSFGKGLVQIIRPVSYGMALKITTSKYFTPSGRYIQSVDYQQQEDGEEEADTPEAFTTQAGRTVYQLNGIAPDIELEDPQPGRLEIALLRGNHFFDFANRFAAQREEMPLPGRDDAELMQAFTEYLEGEDFSFESKAERLFKQLQQEVADAGEAGSAPSLDVLEAEIKEQKNQMMRTQQPVLLRRLYAELSNRFPGDIPQAKLQLQNDAEVEAALSLLRDSSQYESLLQPE